MRGERSGLILGVSIPAALVAVLLLREPEADPRIRYQEWDEVARVAQDLDRAILVEVADESLPLAADMRRTWGSEELRRCAEGRLLRLSLDARDDAEEVRRRLGRRAALATALVEADGTILSVRPGHCSAERLVDWIESSWSRRDGLRAAARAWRERGDVEAGLDLAVQLEELGQLEAAWEILEALGSRDDPRSPTVLQQQAWLRAVQGRLAEARALHADTSPGSVSDRRPASLEPALIGRRRLTEALLCWLEHRPAAALAALPTAGEAPAPASLRAARAWIEGQALHETGQDRRALPLVQGARAPAAGPWWMHALQQVLDHVQLQPHAHAAAAAGAGDAGKSGLESPLDRE